MIKAKRTLKNNSSLAFSKRKNYISWQEYFMGVALLSSFRSKDPNTQVGACIINQKNRIVAIGYNGAPNTLSDNHFNWNNDQNDYLESKYFAVIHAEQNAILNANQSLENCVLYVTHYPCNDCGKLIVQAGIQQIFYLENKYPEQILFQGSKKLFQLCRIDVQKLKSTKLLVSLKKLNFYD